MNQMSIEELTKLLPVELSRIVNEYAQEHPKNFFNELDYKVMRYSMYEKFLTNGTAESIGRLKILENL